MKPNTMTITLKFIYIGDRSVFKMENVPLNVSVENICSKIAKINHMENDTSIRLFQKGRFVDRNELLSSLHPDDGNKITFIIAGVEQHDKPKVNNNSNSHVFSQNILGKPNNFFYRTNKPIDHSYEKAKKRSILWVLTEIITLILLWIFLGKKYIKLNSDQSINFTYKEITKLIRVHFFKILDVLSISFVIHIIFLILSNDGIKMIFLSFKYFCKSLLPNWNTEQFRQDYDIAE